MHDSRTDAAAGQPDAERARVVIAPVVGVGQRPLAVDGAPELARPEDERILQQAALREIPQQRGLRLVDRRSLLADLRGQIAVRVPAAHEELDETHTALGEPPGEQAVPREGPRLPHFGPVHLERRLALVGEVGELGHRELHAVSHLVLRQARGDLRVEGTLGLGGVQLLDQVEHPPPVLARDSAGVLEVEHRALATADLAPGVASVEETAAPEALRQRLCVPEALADQDHERGQIIIRVPEAVAAPGAEARSARLLVTGLEEGDRRLVVDRVGVHRTHEAQLTRHPTGEGHQLADPRAVLPVRVAAEAEHRRRDGEARLAAGHPGQALALPDRVGQVLVEAPPQRGLVVPQVEVARPALHVQVDDPLRLRREVGGGQGAGELAGAGGWRCDQRGERGPTEQRAGARRGAGGHTEEAAPGQEEPALAQRVVLGRLVAHRFSPQPIVIVACRLRRALETIVQAATSAAFSPSRLGASPIDASASASSASSA